MGYRASVTNPEHWSTFDFAMKMAQRPGFCDGIGFVFTAQDPYAGLDLDNIWPTDAAETPLWAQEILDSVAAEQPRPPLSDAKRQELDRRLADAASNPADGVPWEQVEAAALARFGR